MSVSAVSVIQRLHKHRNWVNLNLLSASAEISVEKLQTAFPIGQGSIWKSLLHMYGAEFVWLEALLGNEAALVPGDLPGRLPGNQQGDGAIAGLDELRRKWTALDQRWAAYLSSLTSESLEDVVYKTASSSGVRFGTRRMDILLHVCTHAHYTSAQVINMLRQCGVEKLPETMLISLARSEGS